jgi:transcriptional regulator with XRE-family HTH domain
VSLLIDFARQVRIEKGLSQGEAAKRFGVSTATISAIERGERPDRVYVDYLLSLMLAPNSHKRTLGGDLRIGRRKSIDDDHDD